MIKNGAAYLQAYLFWWYCKEGSRVSLYDMEVEKRSGGMSTAELEEDAGIFTTITEPTEGRLVINITLILDPNETTTGK